MTTCAALWEEDETTYQEHFWSSRRDVNMTPESCKVGVERLKNWLENHPYLPRLVGANEDAWLGNYLFLNKNDLEKTKKNLEAYFKLRTTLPEAFHDRLTSSARIRKSFETTCLAIVPKLTDKGQMVFFYHHLTPDVSEFEMIPMGQRLIAMIDVQLNAGIHRAGTTAVVDLSNSRINHLTKYQPVRLVRAFFNNVWSVYPERVSQIHIINPPTILHVLLTFFRPFLKEKVRKRIVIHSNLESLYEHIPKSHLPSDYGGECADLITLNRRWERILTDNAAWLETCGKMHKIPDEKWPKTKKYFFV